MLVCLSIVVGHSQLICHTLPVQSSVYYQIVAVTVEMYLRWNCQPNFAVYYWSFSSTQWVATCVSSVVAYSDFTRKSPDYVPSKAGLFSTKRSQTIIAWTLLLYKIYTSSHTFLVASLDLVTMWGFLHMRVGVKDCAIVAQSRDRTSVLHNLDIAQLQCATLGFWECATQSQDCANSQIVRNTSVVKLIACAKLRECLVGNSSSICYFSLLWLTVWSSLCLGHKKLSSSLVTDH